MILRRRPAPVTPPVVADDEKRTELAAALLFTTPPSDRALAGWHDWTALELDGLGVFDACEGGVA